MTKYIANHCRANIIVVENDLQLQKILQFRQDFEDLKAIVQYSGTSTQAYCWEGIMKMGRESIDLDPKVDERLSDIAINQCCLLVYTSGTTGLPKAAMLSHDNISFACRSLVDSYHLTLDCEKIVSYLPLSHIAAYLGDMMAAMCVRGTTYFADNDALKGTLSKTLQEVQPTIFFGEQKYN